MVIALYIIHGELPQYFEETTIVFVLFQEKDKHQFLPCSQVKDNIACKAAVCQQGRQVATNETPTSFLISRTNRLPSFRYQSHWTIVFPLSEIYFNLLSRFLETHTNIPYVSQRDNIE